MRSIVDKLMALQRLLPGGPEPALKRAEQTAALRKGIPESLLRTFDRFVDRKKNPVAIVRNGVCSECHLQIAIGTLGSLAFGEGVPQCGNCSRFLYLPEDAPVSPPEPAPKTKTPARRKPRAGRA